MLFAFRMTKTRIRTHNVNIYYLLLFHGKNGYANAPHYHLVCTLPFLFRVLIVKEEDNAQGYQLCLRMLPISRRENVLTIVLSSE
jgi:hypothetical protein